MGLVSLLNQSSLASSGSSLSSISSIKIVKSENDLSNPVSDVLYWIDSTINLTSSIKVPEDGIFITGSSRKASVLTSDLENFTLFENLNENAGDIRLSSLSILIDTQGSKIFDNKGNYGSLVYLVDITLSNNVELGILDTYGMFINQTSAFNISEGFTLKNNCLGIRINNALFRNFGSSGSVLFRAGDNFLLKGRFVTDGSFEINSGATCIDFTESHIENDGNLYIQNASFSGNGVFTSNIDETNKKSLFIDSLNIKNTKQRSIWVFNSEKEITFSLLEEFKDISLDPSFISEVWFSNDLKSGSIYNSSIENYFNIDCSISYTCDINTKIELVLRQYNNSDGSYSDLITKKVLGNGSLLKDKIEVINLKFTTLLKQNDRIEVWIKNMETLNSVIIKQSNMNIVII